MLPGIERSGKDDTLMGDGQIVTAFKYQRDKKENECADDKSYRYVSSRGMKRGDQIHVVVKTDRGIPYCLYVPPFIGMSPQNR
jgi:hypothetical protein